MADAVCERDSHYRIRYEYVGSRATLHSTRGQQAAGAYFGPELSIALRRSRYGW